MYIGGVLATPLICHQMSHLATYDLFLKYTNVLSVISLQDRECLQNSSKPSWVTCEVVRASF